MKRSGWWERHTAGHWTRAFTIYFLEVAPYSAVSSCKQGSHSSQSAVAKAADPISGWAKVFAQRSERSLCVPRLAELAALLSKECSFLPSTTWQQHNTHPLAPNSSIASSSLEASPALTLLLCVLHDILFISLVAPSLLASKWPIHLPSSSFLWAAGKQEACFMQLLFPGPAYYLIYSSSSINACEWNSREVASFSWAIPDSCHCPLRELAHPQIHPAWPGPQQTPIHMEASRYDEWR